MCGIAGIITLPQKGIKIEEKLNAMANLISHRGPDNKSIWYDGHIGFAHTRLSLLDLSSNANQPFYNSNYVLVYNGEIYNYSELRIYLIEKFKLTFKTNSDTEVLFQLLIHVSLEKSLLMLKGMFAFSFFDKANRKLYVVRDRFGIKPLFYSISNNEFLFASEYKAISFTNDGYSTAKHFLIQALSGVYETQRHISPLEGISQLEPGYFLTIDTNTLALKKQKWFILSQLVNETQFNKRQKSKFDEIVEEFDVLFRNSVKSMCMADAPMGVFVSGGIDSSLCASVSREFADLKLFSANVVGKYSEISAANELANFLNVKLEQADYNKEDYARLIVDCTWNYEAPILLFVNSLPFSSVAKIAREQNIKAVLTGENSDELFLGYPRLLTKRYDNLLLLPYNIFDAFYKKIPTLSKYLEFGKVDIDSEILTNHSTGYEEKGLANEFKRSIEFLRSDPEEYRCSELTAFFMTRHLHSLLWRNDRIGMMHSIESRFPFLDEDLVEFGINLPAKFKIAYSNRIGNWKHPFLVDKAVVRKASQKYLPKSLYQRNKKGFPVDSHDGKTITVGNGFFINGFWQTEWKISDTNMMALLDEIDPKVKIKLSSVEIWGRLFVLKQTKNVIQKEVVKWFKFA
jgi:asparagine synthase (glutamine-hydrolysing)